MDPPGGQMGGAERARMVEAQAPRAEEAEAYYAKLIAEEAATGEPELLLLAELCAGGTAVDVGANRGVYAFALAARAREVHAFEANPDYAEFARRMLGPRARVHEVALSNARGRAPFFVPIADDGGELHLAGNLKNTHPQFARQRVVDARVETLDGYGLTGVSFIKVDVEGSELEVLEGAAATIARDRPVLLLELLSGIYPDPLATALEVCASYRYSAFVVHEGRRLDAAATIKALNTNSTWGSAVATRNVLFLARP
jgi:FkbM family methyltransferase